jgi:hypothetical protein
MSTWAFIFMIAVQGLVTVVTIYYFVKVLRAPSKPEPDSYSDND